MQNSSISHTLISGSTIIILSGCFLSTFTAGLLFANWSSTKDKDSNIDFGEEANHLIDYSTRITLEQTDEFRHQVAGHVKEPILTFGNSILKPLNKRLHYLRELRFYHLTEIGAHWTQNAKRFVPNFTGWYKSKTLSASKTIRDDDKSSGMPKESNDSMDDLLRNHQLYLGLEDLTANFHKPCAIDIKMGTQTFEPGADLSKRRREVRKCPHQAEVGFRITGFQVYDVRSDTFSAVNKEFGRKLQPGVVYEALAAFFYDGVRLRRDVVLAAIQELENLLLWFRNQISTHFYCSSLLITYDSWQGREYTAKYRRQNATHFLEKLGPQFPAPHPELPDQTMEEPAGVPLDDDDGNVYEATASVDSSTRALKMDIPLPDDSISSSNANFDPKYRGPTAAYGGLKVKMIDFAHALPGQTGLDYGYIHGLQSLISRLHAVLADTEVTDGLTVHV
jgi:hypothetical protein